MLVAAKGFAGETAPGADVPIGSNPERSGIMYNLNVLSHGYGVLCAGTPRREVSRGGCLMEAPGRGVAVAGYGQCKPEFHSGPGAVFSATYSFGISRHLRCQFGKKWTCKFYTRLRRCSSRPEPFQPAGTGRRRREVDIPHFPPIALHAPCRKDRDRLSAYHPKHRPSA